MDVLAVHNSYQQHGGEDEVFRAESALLTSRGHRVLEYRADNQALRHRNIASIAAGTMWNQESYGALRSLIRRERPQVVHVHNTLPLISPAAYYAAKREHVPVVQTLHNYRLLCPSATLFRDGAPCTKCVGRSIPWAGIAHRCYRGSAAASGTVSAMLSLHHAMRTWTRCVDVYLALTEWSRDLFVEAGLPARKVIVKPNFLFSDPQLQAPRGRSSGAVFVGRLTPEKGIRTLLQAWRGMAGTLELEIIGDGPLAAEVHSASREIPGVRCRGALEKQQVFEALANAQMLIVPSEWYEPFSLVVIEAYAMGVPVIASKTGGLQDIVHDGRTGLHCEAANAEDLRSKILWLSAHHSERAAMGRQARIEYEMHYTADANYSQLMEAYRRAIGARSLGPINVASADHVDGMPIPGVRFYP